MIRCFVRIVNGAMQDHPVIASNFKAAFPDCDIDAGPLPDGWERFDRPTPPELGPYDVSKSSEYARVDGVWTDIWTVVSMTEEEKTAKQNEVKAWWAENGHPSWSFNEELCLFVPPIPMPEDGEYTWDEETTSWVEVT